MKYYLDKAKDKWIKYYLSNDQDKTISVEIIIRQIEFYFRIISLVYV